MGWTLIGVIGGGINVLAALVLVLVVSPARTRYGGMIVTYNGDNPGLKRFLRHQEFVGAAVLVGTTLQLLSATFSGS